MFDIEAIEKSINYHFNDQKYLWQAFVHSSFGFHYNLPDNERMEFVGDALLKQIVVLYLYEKYPGCSAGRLSKMCNALVSRDCLAGIMNKFDVLRYLQVDGSSANIKNDSQKLSANLFEAILCAVYFDGGQKCAEEFVMNCMKEFLDNAENWISNDYVTLVKEYCDKRKLPFEFVLTDKSGPDNKPTFTFSLVIDGKTEAVGKGPNQRVAKSNASKELLNKWSVN